MKLRILQNPGLALQLGVALLLGVGFLAICVRWALADVLVAFADDKVTNSIVDDQVFGPVLTGRIVQFALSLLLLHFAFGMTALALARLTAEAEPRFAEGRPLRLILAWFLVLVIVALMANASWYPSSRFSAEFSWLHRSWQGLRPIHGLLMILLTTVATLAWRALRRRNRPLGWFVSVAAVALLLSIAASLADGRLPTATAAPFPARPHVVIIGLDSLRNDLAGVEKDDLSMPQLDAFLRGAHRFSDTTSPLARTFPSLASVITGRHPVTTNARFNLMPRRLVRELDTLGDALKAAGYHSVYATDEVRFANFDESFGFDQLITPPIGASDFMLGKAGDLPLVNLLSPTRVGAWLFPATHANRAAYVTYRPQSFVRKLEREITVTRPEFLFVHLTLTHWPYSWAGLATPSTPPTYRAAYRRAIAEIDSQFGAILGVLERRGVLSNAIVVVMSDHGEALGGPTDSMLRQTGTADEIWNSLWGHGTSVVSPHQYGVLLAMRAYGQARLPGTPVVHDWPVSLEDVRPTLQEFATGAAPTGVDGVSLLPYLRDPGAASALAARVRFTETDFNTPMVLAGRYNVSGLMHEAAAYYEIVPETGWVQLREDRLPELLAKKQRAAMSANSLLAAIPSWTDDTTQYLFTDRRSPLPRKLQGRPDPAAEPEAARLWDALQARFPGEIRGVPEFP